MAIISSHHTVIAVKKIRLLKTYWGRVTHVCVGRLTSIVSDNGLSPSRCQAIIWTNAGIFLIGSLGASEIFVEIREIHLKMSSGKWPHLSRPQCVKRYVIVLLAFWKMGGLTEKAMPTLPNAAWRVILAFPPPHVHLNWWRSSLQWHTNPS